MIYPAKAGLTIGFHGCDSSVRTAVVLNETNLLPSKNDYDWLGHGIYFWENNRQRAIQFAEEMQNTARKNKSQILHPAALGAVIDMGYCLDLLDSKHLQIIRLCYEKLVTAYAEMGEKLPKNISPTYSNQRLIRKLDCAVIQNLHEILHNLGFKPFDSVRGVFVEGDELYPSAGFHEKNHIQICVRNPNCIKGYFCPREHDPLWTIP